MRRIAVVVALNLAAAAAYGFVAAQMGFFSHMGETLFSSPDSLGYRDVGDWLFGAIPNSVESAHRPFLYPLLLGTALRIGGDPAIWALNLLLWLGTVNVTAAATWRMTGRALLGAIVFLGLATNVSLIVLSLQALTELTVACLESIWILGLALSALPPSRPRDIALLLLPISLLTVVKPAYQIELLVALLLLAIVIWRLPRGRAAAAAVVAACFIPIAFQLGLNATANHVLSLSSTGDAEVRGYYVSQVYASINGLPDDLVAARKVVYGWSNGQVVSFLVEHRGPAIGTLISNLHSNLTSSSNFIDPGKTPLLAAAVRDTNRAFLRLHLIFLPIVALAIWRRRDVRLLLLYAFALVVILVPSLIVDQGDRYIEMALPLWAAAYALAVSDLLPDIFGCLRTGVGIHLKVSRYPTPSAHAIAARKLRPMSAIARWLPASGLLAVVALALTGLISPPPPVAGAPAADVAAYYAGHHIGLEIESVADGIGVTLLVVFAAVFHARIRTAPSMTAFVAAAVLAACTLVQVAAFHALAFRPNPEPARAALLNDLQSFVFQVTTFPTLLLLGAAGAAILSSGALPRWLGLAAAVAAALQAVTWVSFFAPSGILAAGALPDIVAFAALLGWLVTCSIVMLVRSGEGVSAPN